MELHVQQCQKCFSRDVRNVLVREGRDLVYVQCAACESLVARYIISSSGYFHIGKGYESFLRSHERDGMSLQTRDMADEFKQTEKELCVEFEKLKEILSSKYKD